MMRTLEAVIAELPEDEQREIARRSAEILAEEMTMRGLREARKVSRSKLARKLGVDKEQVSCREQETDLHIAALRRSVKRLGGKLTLLAEFPDGAPVAIDGFRTIADSGPAPAQEQEQPEATAPRKRSRKITPPRAGAVHTGTPLQLQS